MLKDTVKSIATAITISAVYLMLSGFFIQKLWGYSLPYFWVNGPQNVVHPTYWHVLGVSALFFVILSVIGYSYDFARKG
jgi:hypothetical protein